MPRKTPWWLLLSSPYVVPASMRPRPDAAENVPVPVEGRHRYGGFNEAAARCRGKRLRVRRVAVHALASMRPRPDAAENVGRIAKWTAVDELQ